jgi:predicted PurR-regulated permease PerM
MQAPPHDAERLRKPILVVLALGITLLFLFMIRQFLMVLLLAAIASGMFRPLYKRALTVVGGRSSVASALTVTVALFVVIGPLLVFLGIVTREALRLSALAGPFAGTGFGARAGIDALFDRYPVLAPLAPHRALIVAKVGELAGDAGAFVVSGLTAAARETAGFLFLLFVLLYSMFFFLMDGVAVLRKILYYLPLPPADEHRMIERFLSVSRATIKGTLMIGALQGALGGLAFWVAGIPGAAVWAVVLAVLSAIPGIGPVLVWMPAAGYLGVMRGLPAAALFAAWFAGVVGTVDNFLRPRLIGKDTKMPDLLILLGTLGGIVLFGPPGFIVGPIVAALLVTVWDIYGETFRDVLPPPDSVRSEPTATPRALP